MQKQYRNSLVGFAIVVLVTSCASSSISKAEFLSKGNALCTSLNETIAQFFTAGPPPTEEQGLAFATDVFVPGISNTVQGLRELGFPDGDKVVLEELYAEIEKLRDEIAKDPSDAISNSENPFASINLKANNYGLTACDGG